MKLFLILAFVVQICQGLVGPNERSVYQETIPLLWVSSLVYTFADLLQEVRMGKLKLDYPPEITNDMLLKFKDESIDFRNFSADNNGMSFNIVADIFNRNMDKIKELYSVEQGIYLEGIVKKLEKLEDQDLTSDSFYLETFRSIKSKRQCVYGIVKDFSSKKIIIVFRGSVGLGESRDWQSNIKSFLVKMKTPKSLKGKSNKDLLVHKGFYEYLFDNKEIIAGKQRYDKIISDLEPLLEDGYKIWVTGHSLGAALSSIAAFKLADKEWIPKPVTCVSFASPFTGDAGYRTAYEQLEKDGLLRYLRFTNYNDFVPAIPPALSWRRFKHVGINIRLYDKKIKMHHSSNNSFWKDIENSFLKSPFNALEEHSLPLHEERMTNNGKGLKQRTIDDLYNDKSIMGTDFVRSEL
jgi:hypothetical protein